MPEPAALPPLDPRAGIRDGRSTSGAASLC
jgi:hypothetical protein